MMFLTSATIKNSLFGCDLFLSGAQIDTTPEVWKGDHTGRVKHRTVNNYGLASFSRLTEDFCAVR